MCHVKNLRFRTSADPEGGDRGSGPPLRFVRGGVLCTCLWVGEGVQRLFLPHYYLFFLARFARQYYTNILHVYILSSSMFSMEWSSFLYISLIKIKKIIQLPIPCFYERAFSYFSRLELHDFTPFTPKIFWGRTPRPPSPTHLQDKNYNIICVFCREGPAIVQQNTPLLKINVYVDDCLDNRFKPFFCRRERATTTLRLKTFLPFSLLLFFCLSKFSGVGPPLMKIPGSAPAG